MLPIKADTICGIAAGVAGSYLLIATYVRLARARFRRSLPSPWNGSADAEWQVGPAACLRAEQSQRAESR